MAILEVNNLKKVCAPPALAASRGRALPGRQFSVEAGEYVAIMGESGSGKTTLLNILAALDQPTSGEVLLDGAPMGQIEKRSWPPSGGTTWALSSRTSTSWTPFPSGTTSICPWCSPARCAIRRWKSGSGPWRTPAHPAPLEKYPLRSPAAKSSGAAVARALITQPKLLLADEPTGQLDSGATGELLTIFEEVNKSGQTILMVTHSPRRPATLAGCCSSGTGRFSTRSTGAMPRTPRCIRRSRMPRPPCSQGVR